MTRRTYDTAEIVAVLERVRAKIGEDQFSTLRLMELEKVVRTFDPDKRLPGKTLLRATINSYRAKRWPAMAPRRLSDRFRW